jgi:hypothetical protein
VLMGSVLIVGPVIGVTAVRVVLTWFLPTAEAGGPELWRSPVMSTTEFLINRVAKLTA